MSAATANNNNDQTDDTIPIEWKPLKTAAR